MPPERVRGVPPLTDGDAAGTWRGETVDTEGILVGGGIRGVAMSPKHRTGPDAYVKVFRHA